MKRTKLLTGFATGCILAAFPIFTHLAYADENYVYGTMDIPYQEFYEAEGIGYEVDAVSSATDGKWKNENLTAGTYYQENADGTGTILGVSYPVALTEETLTALGENNYNFTPVETQPDAYKIVTIDGTEVNFSSVQGETAELNVSASILTDTPWGDYQITIDALNNSEGTSDIGRIYGVILTTQTNDRYALRHLENIWRDSIAWSNGFVTQEPHGNQLNYENFEGLMGQTITEICYITDSGYHNLPVSFYVPIKFHATLEVTDADITDGVTTITMDGFPDEYKKAYALVGMEAQISEDQIAFQEAMPGQYTLIVSDTDGVYADVSTDFVLFTKETPALYKDGKIESAEGVTEEAYTNYLKNIATISVNGTEYATSGRRSIKIVGEDGTIDLEIESNEEKIFGENGTYSILVNATGYQTPLEFELVVERNNQTTEATTTESNSTSTLENSTEVSTTNTELPANAEQDQKNNTTSSVVPAIVVLVVLVGAGAVVAVRKKR